MFSTGHCFPSTGSKPAGYLIEAIGSESMSGNSGSAVDAAAKQSGPIRLIITTTVAMASLRIPWVPCRMMVPNTFEA